MKERPWLYLSSILGGLHVAYVSLQQMFGKGGPPTAPAAGHLEGWPQAQAPCSL